MSRWACVVAIAALATASAVSGAAGERMLTVSPGEAGRAALVEGRCPTFSWSAVAGAEHYELVVYEFSSQPLAASEAPALTRVLPGGALSWTPGRGDCLEAGKSYAWLVRAVGRGLKATWSEERLFRTEADLSAADVREVLERYLSAGGELADLVESEPMAVARPIGAAAGVDTVGSAAPLEMAAAGPGDEEQSAEATALLVAPAPIPFTSLGINALGEWAASGDTAVAVRGESLFSGSSNQGVGYLGVHVGPTGGGEFDGFAALMNVGDDEIGVLGFTPDGGSDNYGVVGVAVGSSRAGRFYNANAAGAVSNEVLLGTSTAAMSAAGPIDWDCPANMDRAGTWCINNTVFAAEAGGPSIARCHNDGKILCPLEAIMTCDQMNIRNSTANSCGHQTDTAGVVLRTFGVDTLGLDAFGRLVTYGASSNALNIASNATVLKYFCCKPVSP